MENICQCPTIILIIYPVKETYIQDLSTLIKPLSELCINIDHYKIKYSTKILTQIIYYTIKP